ncbi:hypothetical protein MMC17_003583 [Xylographa soralifera]|nr:hypothetical protein [Xylographa soralifera]
MHPLCKVARRETVTSRLRGKKHMSMNEPHKELKMGSNECKRRKIKCNGETPCLRCGNLSLQCVYEANCCSSGFKDTEEFRRMNAHIQSLQEQVDNLYANLNVLLSRSDGKTFSNPNLDVYPQNVSQEPSSLSTPYQRPVSSPESRARPLQFRGHTTSAFSFDVANSSLQTMGITNLQAMAATQSTFGPDEEGTMAENEPSHSPQAADRDSGLQATTRSLKDPLWSLSREEVIRLCRVYDDEVGLMYPMLDIDKTIAKANRLFDFMEAAARTGLLREEIDRGDAFHDDDSNILKMVLAASLTLVGGGYSEMGSRLFESVRIVSESRLWQPVNMKGLMLLVIVAQYYFHLDDESQAYRITGLAARLCFELGLHRRDSLTKAFTTEDEIFWAVRLFWSIYQLDRRWSFGTGMPFAIQDDDIDPLLPQPDARTPYLAAMVPYGRIASKAWKTIMAFESAGSEVRKDEIEFLDYQIEKWRASIPEILRYQHHDTHVDQEVPQRGNQRLQIILYLRANQLRTMIYMPVLHSATSLFEHRRLAQTVVDVAKETIKALTNLNQTTDIYRTQQISFNYFLVSALAVLFLAVAHAPLEFNRQVRDEFYQALDLVKGFSTKSHISRRLWKTIRGLKEIGPKLGVVSRQGLPDIDDPHSSAAVAMAGLAGHQVDELAVFPPSHDHNSLGSSPMNGQQMSYELTNLFEAAGEYNGMMPSNVPVSGVSGFAGEARDTSRGYGGMPGMSGLYGNEEEFARIMRQCF